MINFSEDSYNVNEGKTVESGEMKGDSSQWQIAYCQ